jgi:hypothetical protein
VALASSAAYACQFVAEASDLPHLARCLRAHRDVVAESVCEVPESHRVLYSLDETLVSSAEVAAADLGVRMELGRVASAHRWPA